MRPCPVADRLQAVVHRTWPPNGFLTVKLLFTDVTPRTPLTISVTLSICDASTTVPPSGTLLPLATILMFPALISLCFTMAA